MGATMADTINLRPSRERNPFSSISERMLFRHNDRSVFGADYLAPLSDLRTGVRIGPNGSAPISCPKHLKYSLEVWTDFRGAGQVYYRLLGFSRPTLF